ncbi:MAG: hypothetical protein R2741_00375 [Methanolobus sp.]
MHNPAGKMLTCAIILLCILSFSGLATAESSVEIIPSSKTVSTEETFTLDITLEPEEPISGLQFDLTYNGEFLTVTTVEDQYFLQETIQLLCLIPA